MFEIQGTPQTEYSFKSFPFRSVFIVNSAHFGNCQNVFVSFEFTFVKFQDKTHKSNKRNPSDVHRRLMQTTVAEILANDLGFQTSFFLKLVSHKIRKVMRIFRILILSQFSGCFFPRCTVSISFSNRGCDIFSWICPVQKLYIWICIICVCFIWMFLCSKSKN